MPCIINRDKRSTLDSTLALKQQQVKESKDEIRKLARSLNQMSASDTELSIKESQIERVDQDIAALEDAFDEGQSQQVLSVKCFWQFFMLIKIANKDMMKFINVLIISLLTPRAKIC